MNKYLKNNLFKISILLILLVLIFILGYIFIPKSKIASIIRRNLQNSSDYSTKTSCEIKSDDGNNFDILITIENQNGIEKVTDLDTDTIINCNGRKTIALDRRNFEYGKFYYFKVKLLDNAEEELYTILVDGVPQISITNIDTLGDGSTKTINIAYKDTDNFESYYSLDDGATWQEYVSDLNVLETDNKTITAKTNFKESSREKVKGQLILLKRGYEEPVVVSPSLLIATKEAIMKNDTRYRLSIKDEEYRIHSYIEYNDLILSQNTTFGDSGDVGTASEYAKYMVLLKVNGNLTINNGVNLTTYGTSYGGPKGLLLYVTGDLENNGTISMTARGAKAQGQNVYLWKNADSTYEYVPINGANRSTSGTARQTGGGGNGRGNGASPGLGSAGTSYSGGTGGGGIYAELSHNFPASIHGSINGGTGGTGSRATYYGTGGASGGAGNPGGGNINAHNGQNGTGGLLTVFSNSFINNGYLTANGSNGGQNKTVGGGSGGGSINIFYCQDIQAGAITANGGNSAGNGCISIGNISSGTYVNSK